MKKTISTIILILLCFLTFTGCCDKQKNNVKTVVVDIEKYGHVVLDLTRDEFNSYGFSLGDLVCVYVNNQKVEMPYYDGYYSDPGFPMLRGAKPENNIAVCINYESFSDQYGVAIGDEIEITLVKKEAMLDIQEICSLQYSNDRKDYDSDEKYTNFRSVTVGRIKEGVLYRSASPILNKFGRATMANSLISLKGVKTILNLSDSNEDIEQAFEEDDFNSEYYKELYLNGQVKAIDLGANFRSQEFIDSIVQGLIFLSQKETPYHIHCEEGKDRAGFTSMIIEALMGATLDEIIADYMLSFYNYYGITKETEPKRYQTVLDKNLLAMMYHVFDVDNYEELASINLELAVTNYLLRNNMPEESINDLKNKLS